MNKIERAIRDIKMEIKNAKQKVLIAETQIKCLEEQLNNLEKIEGDKYIPHVEAPQEKINTIECNMSIGTGVTGVMNFPDFDKNITHTYVKYPDTQNTI
jgi:CO dehydrogenase/acetyl-CoA synthase epsilon subunit